ncbi:site-specific integrase [Haloarcula sp. Atlit-7R]|jgi:integrase|uniref:tyrosine-type recombinase/integrase n=1 Tax=Haloarcula sp. Atlit-7R TaxID=2282125 RepID=UPI0018F6D458|nr:site-specific integrase [Haloarcula sp. Atlit-7R]
MPLDKPNSLERYDVLSDDAMEPSREIVIIPKGNQKYLNHKQALDYHEYRKKFLTYLLKLGKNPQKAKGYSPDTVRNTSYRAARFDLWTWNNRGGYSIPPDHDDAQAYMDEVALRDVSDSTKGKALEMLRRYSAWLQRRHGREEWEFSWEFQSGGDNNAPRDFLTKEERRQVRQAALSLDGNPAYGMDESELPDSTSDGNWKYTSIVWTSLDAGLRPVEVGRAKVSWVDSQNGLLRIPREESSKNEGNWTVSLTDRTATALSRWIEQRGQHGRYDDTDSLWLTQHGNPYGSKELGRLLRKLCDRAGIEYENREMSWYSIRHSVGTYMTKERDLAAAKAQLRHRNAKTTMKYDQVPVSDRRDALDKMG